MSLSGLTSLNLVGLGFVLLFVFLMVGFAFLERRRTRHDFRSIAAFERLSQAIGLAVETGKRLHLTLGRGGAIGFEGASALVGLNILEQVARASAVSDRPPTATSGDGTLTVLSQDTIQSARRSMGESGLFDPASGRLTGLTPFAYAAGTLPVIYDEQVSATVLAGHFGVEAALIADATERQGGYTMGGSDSLPAQAVLYTVTEKPLIGEDLYASGAYVRSGNLHYASLRVQDVFRWLLVLLILGGSALKFLGLL